METAEVDMRILSGKPGAAPKGQCILPLVGYRHDEGRKEGASSSSCSGSPAGESTFRNARGPLPATIRGGPSPEPAPRAVCCELAKAVLHTHTLGLVSQACPPGQRPLAGLPDPPPHPTDGSPVPLQQAARAVPSPAGRTPAPSQPYREAFMHSGGGGGQDAVTEWQLWQDPTVVMRTIMHMNRVLVPVAAGDRMKEVIEMCLTCVDNAANWGAVHDGRG